MRRHRQVAPESARTGRRRRGVATRDEAWRPAPNRPSSGRRRLDADLAGLGALGGGPDGHGVRAAQRRPRHDRRPAARRGRGAPAARGPRGRRRHRATSPTPTSPASTIGPRRWPTGRRCCSGCGSSRARSAAAEAAPVDRGQRRRRRPRWRRPDPSCWDSAPGSATRSCALAHTPVVAGAAAAARCSRATKWRAVVASSTPSPPAGRATGTSPSTRQPDGSAAATASVAGCSRPGRRSASPSYRYGGGRVGVVKARRISPGWTASTGSTVTNPLPTVGGEDGESITSALERIPGELSRHDRAVTAEDFRALATIAGVGRVECLPRFDPTSKSFEAAGCRHGDGLAARGPAPSGRAAWPTPRCCAPSAPARRAPPGHDRALRDPADLQAGRRLGRHRGQDRLQRPRRTALGRAGRCASTWHRSRPSAPTGRAGRWATGCTVPSSRPRSCRSRGWTSSRTSRSPTSAPATAVPGTVELAAWEVPELSELTVVEGSAPDPGTGGVTPPPGEAPVPVPVPKDEC